MTQLNSFFFYWFRLFFFFKKDLIRSIFTPKMSHVVWGKAHFSYELYMIVDYLLCSKWFNLLSFDYINNIRLNEYYSSSTHKSWKKMIANHLQPHKKKQLFRGKKKQVWFAKIQYLYYFKRIQYLYFIIRQLEKNSTRICNHRNSRGF